VLLLCRLLRRPIQYLAPFQSALKEFVANVRTGGNLQRDEDGILKKKDATTYTIGLDGNLGGNRVSPRQLGAPHLGELVCVEGIATRCKWTSVILLSWLMDRC
jgi:DNA replication licensing factor MCM3